MADMNIKDASTVTKVGLLLSSTGLLFHVIGFATTYWYETTFRHAGLWADCLLNSCGDFFNKSASLQAVEVFETIGLIVAILAVGAFLYWSFVENVPPRSGLNTIIVAGLGSAAISIFIGDIIYGVSVIPEDDSAAYSFILSIVGGIGLALGAILLFTQLNGTTSDEDSERQPLRNNESKQHQYGPNCCQAGAASDQASDAKKRSSSTGYLDRNTEAHDNQLSHSDADKNGTPNLTKSLPTDSYIDIHGLAQPQPRDGITKINGHYKV